MNGDCGCCPIIIACGYEYKPVDCCDYRKFKLKVGCKLCPTCEGDGPVSSIFSCNVCRGVGYVEVKDEPV